MVKKIYIMDRGYTSLSNIYKFIKNNDKFILRVSFYYNEECRNMKTDDETIEIKSTSLKRNRTRRNDKELYDYLTEEESINVRCARIVLKTGEIEYLFTNLTEEKISYDELKELYNLRWKIETNYGHLKNHVQIESITSGKKILIEQDIYSQIYIANIVQSFINDTEKEINQGKYKNKMKVNCNMAIGLLKNNFIYIIIEKNTSKRHKMMDDLERAIIEHLVPVKDGRKNQKKVILRISAI